MNVKLISYTQPTDPNITNLLELVAYTARVSNPANQHNNATAEKLVDYLIKHRHWAPLEMADVTFEINCTRDIARQFIRHSSIKPQEFSQRYAKATEFEISECRLQDNNNRQNSLNTEDEDLKLWWTTAQNEVIDKCNSLYNEALDKGIAKEVARKILPEGLTMSRLYMKGSLRSWLHYIEVRTHPSTQKEHREVANAIKQELQKVFPYKHE